MKSQNTFIVLISLLVISCVAILEPPLVYLAGAVALGIAIIAVRSFNPISFPLAALALVVYICRYLWPQQTPLFFLIPATIIIILVWKHPRLRAAENWIRIGRIDRVSWYTIAGIILLSSIALYFWFGFNEQSTKIWIQNLPDLALVWLLLIGAGFAFLNAAIEETLFRGLIQGTLDSVFGKSIGTLGLQAVAFGLVHYHGVPSGVSGIILAAFYGFALGWLRRRTGGLLAPFIAHIVADAVIFAELVLLRK
jgi:membrane protease YdiL (CAAX protease family)